MMLFPKLDWSTNVAVVFSAAASCAWKTLVTVVGAPKSTRMAPPFCQFGMFTRAANPLEAAKTLTISNEAPMQAGGAGGVAGGCGGEGGAGGWAAGGGSRGQLKAGAEAVPPRALNPSSEEAPFSTRRVCEPSCEMILPFQME